MGEVKMTNYLLAALVLVTCTMFIWTINIINTTNDMQIPTAISAFNG